MQAARYLQTAAGLAVAAAGAFMMLRPELVAIALERAHETSVQRINLRATFGGTALGLGGFVAWLPAARPWRRTLLGLLLWLMACIGAARTVGFVLDGQPDGLQWFWLSAEAVIALGCWLGLRSMARRAFRPDAAGPGPA